jgi:ADP-heptose:LPS heptosyltransferase
MKTINELIIQFLNTLLKIYFIRSKTTLNYNVLFVKIDAIGDYLIARNLMNEYISKHPGYKFHLVANSRLKTFIDLNDKKNYESITYCSIKSNREFLKTIQLINNIRSTKYCLSLNLSYSRTSLSDKITIYCGAETKVTFLGDDLNYGKLNKKKIDKLYDKLVDIKKINGNEYLHEFSKIKFFFEEISLCKSTFSSAPTLEATYLHNKRNLIICPGSNELYKIWSSSNFAILANKLLKEFQNIKIIILCGPGESEIGNNIYNSINPTFVNRVIRHDLNDINELIKIINTGIILVGNDSAPIHIATILNINNYCIFNGSRYGRFVPYNNLFNTSNKCIMPSNIEKCNDPYQYNSKTFKNNEINNIEPDRVFDEVCKDLTNILKKDETRS